MNLVYFVLIYEWLHNKIQSFGFSLMNNVMEFVAGIALLLVTVWIMLVGYRVLTGQMREPLISVVTNMARISVIVTFASSASIFGNNIFTMFTTDLNQAVNQLVTGNNNTIQQSIDQNLVYTEIAMSAIDAVQTVPNDPEGQAMKSRSDFFAGIGTAGPPITAAVLLLMYEFAMALFIGLAPLFILCLIFDYTKSLFQRWLLYGIGTLFSMAVLNVVVSMVLQLTGGVAAAMWTTTILNQVFNTQVEGLSQQAMEQGGIGMILTMLIMTVPPMASNFFQGTLGNFMHYSAFSDPQAHRGADGRVQLGQQQNQQQLNNQQTGLGSSAGNLGGGVVNNSALTMPRQPPATDTTRLNPQYGNAPAGPQS